MIQINDQKKTVLCILHDTEDSNSHNIKALSQVARMVEENGGTVFFSLEDVAQYLNT